MGAAVLLHEAIITDTNSIWEVAMDSDYTLFLYNRNRIDSLYSEIQIRSTFQVLNTIVLDDRRTFSISRLPPVCFPLPEWIDCNLFTN